MICHIFIIVRLCRVQLNDQMMYMQSDIKQRDISHTDWKIVKIAV